MTRLSCAIRSLPPFNLLIASSPIKLANGLRLSVGIDRALYDGEEHAVSRSRAGVYHACLIAPSGRIGVDIETVDRVAVNASEHDAWLSEAERASVQASSSLGLALACHWVLKEAYGKAIGVGLALPLNELSFTSAGAHIILDGAKPGAGPEWRFSLYRCDTLVIGIAYRAMAQARTPLAPLGRKPPMTLVER